MKDIQNKSDVTLLITTFYGRVMKDELLAPHFEGINFDHHIPRIVDFWSFILLDESGFTGNVFDRHVHLNIDERHFKQWLHHFHETTDALFSGEKAELAKQRADVLGFTFQSKLENLRKNK